MLSDIVNFLKSAKSCVDTIINELEEFKKLESDGMKKIDLFIEIIKELGCSVQNLEKAFADEKEIPVEHRLKYLIIKELKFDLDDFVDSIKEYKKWYILVIKREKLPDDLTSPTDISGSKTEGKCTKCWSWCCSTCPCKVSEPVLLNAGIQLALISPSQMNKMLDESFQKIMEKVRIVIELEKDIFGTAIKITHPILQKAWMSFGPRDKTKIEVEEHMLVEALLNRLKDECNGEVANESKCREIIYKFLQGLEIKAGNRPNGKISIDELNELATTELNSLSVLSMLGLDEQPGCVITGLETESQIVSNSTKTEDVLKVLAKYVSEHIGQQNIQIQTTENKQIEELSINSIPAQNSLSPESIKIDLDVINKKLDLLDKAGLIALANNLPIRVTSSDKEGILECEGYGSHWPYKVICEFELDNINSVNSVTATFVAKDQGWGGTGHCNVRYRVGSSKILPAFFIDREKTPSNTYTYIIKKDELEGLTVSDKITFWLCSAPWGGWSAQVTHCDIVIN